MSRMATIFLLFVSATSFAVPDISDLDKNHCQNLITDLGQGRFRTNTVLAYENEGADYLIQRRGSDYILFSPDGEFPLKAPMQTLRDFIVLGDRIWTVGLDGLMEFTLEGELVRRYLETKPRGLYYHPGGKVLFLASWGDGLQAFDMKTKKILYTHPINTSNNNGNYSGAVAITGDGHNNLYIAMTGRTQYGFNGVVTFDLTRNQVGETAEYDKRRAGVIDVYPKIYNRTDEVILNNGGWIHRIKKSDLQSKKKIRPTWKAIPHIMGEYRQFIRIEGDLIFDRDEVFGCGTYNIRDLRQTKSGAFSTNL